MYHVHMHAYLLVGNNSNEIVSLSKKLDSKILPFPILKIDDVRELGKLLKLIFSEKTLVVCENIQNATEEALNAFLKNLEEPQENIYFVLTTPSTSQVLPTIVSRCQIIKNVTKKTFERNKFLDLNKVQKLDFASKIKDRKDAIKFVEDLIYYLHQEKNFTNMELLLKTLTRLRANGNVNLQLSNLGINYE